jgi:hypothetical protein
MGGDSQRPDPVAGLQVDHIHTTDYSQPPSSSVRIRSEDLSNGMANFCEYTYAPLPLGKSYNPQKTGQLSDAIVGESFGLQSEDSDVKKEFNYYTIS